MLDDEADGIDIIDAMLQLIADELHLIKMQQYAELDDELDEVDVDDEIDYLYFVIQQLVDMI